MTSEKISIPRGTRDFNPKDMLRRNHIFNTIRQVFEAYGYMPIETPAMENLSTLLGKYGDEGDRLLFKVLNSGNFLDGVEPLDLSSPDPGALASKISEKGLRYDLTVPFARFVVQHFNEISFPFKRYQIQPVWRADRPQKGRYREFYQCDVDVIGSDSLLNETELVQIVFDIFGRLEIPVITKLNDRKILEGMAEVAGAADHFTDLTVALDKLDKVGRENVFEELRLRGMADAAIDMLHPFLDLKGTARHKLEKLKSLLSGNDKGLKGIADTEFIFSRLDELGLSGDCELDLSLARGLNYYTGTIIEVKAKEAEIGSVCGGGRYDDLTGIFGMPGLSGVGIAFGAERIFDIMTAGEHFGEGRGTLTDALFINFGEKESAWCMKIAARLRQSGLHIEIYPDAAKLKKQMKYADEKGIPMVVLAGEDEISTGKLTVKDMKTGDQQSLSPEQLHDHLLQYKSS